MTVSQNISKMRARQGLAQTQVAAYDHAQRSAPQIDLVWLTWSWMILPASRNWIAVNGWGALHLGNGSESQRSDSSWALPHLRAMPSFNQNVRAPSRSGDGALPNSDMGGSEPFDDKMIELLTQRAFNIIWIQPHDPRAQALRRKWQDAKPCPISASPSDAFDPGHIDSKPSRITVTYIYLFFSF